MRRKDREIIDIMEIQQILDKIKTTHIAMVDDGKPYVIPLSYGYEIEESSLILYFHSAKEGRKIDIFQKNKEVCFEMSLEGEQLTADIPCNSGYYFSSVIGNGEVAFIEDIEEKCKALSRMFKHQSGKEVLFEKKQVESVCVFKVVSKNFTGKRKVMPEAERSNSEKERLAAFEKTYHAILKSQEETIAQMEKLRIEGKTNSVTFKQLMAKKLTNTNMLSLFSIYGIEKK